MDTAKARRNHKMDTNTGITPFLQKALMVPARFFRLSVKLALKVIVVPSLKRVIRRSFSAAIIVSLCLTKSRLI